MIPSPPYRSVPSEARAAAASLLLAALAGCAVGPDFQRPPPPSDTGYTEDALPPAAGQGFARGSEVQADWWTLFHCGELDGLIEQALRANADLQAARATLRQAREAYAAEQGDYLPQVSGTAGATRQRESDASFGLPGGAVLYSLYTASINVSYAVDLWGGTRRQVESAEAEADYQRFELEAARLTLAGNLATSAIQEASLRGQIAASEQIIDAERQELDLVRRRFDLGGAAEAEVLSARATLAAAETGLPPLRKQLAAIRAQLAVYAGATPAGFDARPITLDQFDLPGTLPVTLPSKLVEQRPDIRAAEEQLRSAGALVGVATANMLPQLKLTAGYGDSAVDAGTLLNPASTVWNIGAGLTQPLLDETTLLHRKRAAEAAFDAAAARYRGTVLKAFQDVANALHAVSFDAAALEAEQAAEHASAEALSIAREQYALGAVAFATLLDAERTWQQARLGLVQAEAARYADSVGLFAALGGGWWNRPAPEEPPAADPAKEQTAE
jgi:NodT family efflux transporter outer membrane factor (OMF) lipoprotein